MPRIQERFEVASPAMAVYDALSQPETILGTLPGVSSIHRFDPTHSRVQIGSAGRAHQLDIEITERDPGRRLAWRSGDGRWAGVVEFEALEAQRTLVVIELHDNQQRPDAIRDNGEATSVIDASLQHLKSALQLETSQVSSESTNDAAQDDEIHISRGGAGVRDDASKRPGDAHAEPDWRGSHAPLFGGEYSQAFMRTLSRELDRWWEQLQRGAAAARRTVGNMPAGLNPPIEICERDDALIVRADVPGMKRDDVQVQIDEGLLTIRGERKAGGDDPKTVRRTERAYGAFVRRVPLPEALESEGARAVLRDGVLEVRIPAPRSHRPRTVPVEDDVAESKG
ncbi:MAG TPA: Hsp20 family protein [Burkholderiales bacterium]|nr:Hsp20 family protein [Burkholderiales bacterium]